ncbi:MAG TPA: Holliday junction branch migration protein RuvA [Candidatus Dormibacteraeota bacterium]|nr:Holliday junction branch migration protein RuvA [Candidatus Dormibacteraeota bacterium]
MIGSLEGILSQRSGDSVILDVHGVGYLVTVGGRTMSELPRAGERLRLYTYTYVREDALGLFGFLRQDELTFFKLLLSVKGIGPKAALAILSRAEVRVIKRAVLKEDAALLATIPGIGPKTAARVVLELKGKLRDELFPDEAAAGVPEPTDAMAEAVQVLTGLGYTPIEAKEAVRKVSSGNGGGHSVEQLVTVALKGLDRG